MVDSQSRIGNANLEKAQISDLESKTRAKNLSTHVNIRNISKTFSLFSDILQWEKENDLGDKNDLNGNGLTEIATSDHEESHLDEAFIYLGENPLKSREEKKIREDVANRIIVWIKENTRKKDEKEKLLALAPKTCSLKLTAPLY